MQVLDLFSGIGGFSLGLERAGMETVAFCEIDPFCRKVLAKHWPGVPIHEDIKELDGKQYRGTVDVVCGGFPCQPFSVAGQQKGTKDDRHLWPEMLRIVAQARPAWVIGENVAGFIPMALDDVSFDLEAEGYTVRSFVIPAVAVDAPHRRDRCWIVAYSERPQRGPEREDGNQERQVLLQPEDRSENAVGVGISSEDVSDNGRRGGEGARRGFSSSALPTGWEPEPPVGRVANGIPRRVDRLRAIGNAVVPQIPEIIGKAIMETAQS